MLKYPWHERDGDSKKPNKFGAYRTERADFDFARDGYPMRVLSLEAQIMDHADAVAYSVHDLDDFYRAGLIPLQEIVQALPDHLQSFKETGVVGEDLIKEHYKELSRWFRTRFNRGRYVGDRVQRAALRELTADLIHDFVMEADLDMTASWPRLRIPPLRTVEIEFLQHLVWRYVIDSSRLASQQYGQRRIVRTLFETYTKAINDPRNSERLVPGAFREELTKLNDGPEDGAPHREARVARLAADIVAALQMRRLCDSVGA